MPVMPVMPVTPAKLDAPYRVLTPEEFTGLIRRAAALRLQSARTMSPDALLALPEALVCGLAETYGAAHDIGCIDAQAYRLLERYDYQNALGTPLALPFDFPAYVAARLGKRGSPLSDTDLKRSLAAALSTVEPEAVRTRRKIGYGPTHNDLLLAAAAMDRDAWQENDRIWFQTICSNEDFQAIVMALHTAPDFSTLDIAQGEQVLAAAYSIFYHDAGKGPFPPTVCRFLTGLPNGSGCWLSGITDAVATVPMAETDRARLQGALYGIKIILSIIEGHTKIDRPHPTR